MPSGCARPMESKCSAQRARAPSSPASEQSDTAARTDGEARSENHSVMPVVALSSRCSGGERLRSPMSSAAPATAAPRAPKSWSSKSASHFGCEARAATQHCRLVVTHSRSTLMGSVCGHLFALVGAWPKIVFITDVPNPRAAVERKCLSANGSGEKERDLRSGGLEPRQLVGVDWRRPWGDEFITRATAAFTGVDWRRACVLFTEGDEMFELSVPFMGEQRGKDRALWSPSTLEGSALDQNAFVGVPWRETLREFGRELTREATLELAFELFFEVFFELLFEVTLELRKEVFLKEAERELACDVACVRRRFSSLASLRMSGSRGITPASHWCTCAQTWRGEGSGARSACACVNVYARARIACAREYCVAIV
eukprot:4388308-Pleurochrysis_carterae.AAC.1